MVTLNKKESGYKGIWYFNQVSNDEYVFKYSGGLGTYPANHQPFAIYRKEVHKTFFCYGGTTETGELLHLVSYYDHKLDVVPRPTILLNKQTDDAHDNPVMTIDEQGYIWIFSTSHGTQRPSYIHKSIRPYEIDEFIQIDVFYTEQGQTIPITNFSYMQSWHHAQKFVCFFTKYNNPATRTNFFMTSSNGYEWSEQQRLAAIEEGHYQISAVNKHKAGSAFNYHPDGLGLNYRTNLYYMETSNLGKTWTAADGTELQTPLRTPDNAALVYDYEKEGLKVYTIDIQFDAHNHPIILYITSPGYESGPQNNPRVWTIAHWKGKEWEIKPAMTSNSNYDMGSLYIEGETWRIIGPTEPGAQPYNPGGEIAMWTSTDQGKHWKMERQMTENSSYNHTYVRRPVDAHPDFYGFWADGDCHKPSVSHLYFCDQQGNVRMLPQQMDAEYAIPELITPKIASNKF